MADARAKVFTVSEIKAGIAKAGVGLSEYDFKLSVKTGGRPKPVLKISQIVTSQKRNFRREFKCDVYNKINWICGCAESNKLFCFPCLLLQPLSSKGDSAWVKTGVDDLGHLVQNAKRHSEAKGHMKAVLDLALLGKIRQQLELDSDYRVNIKIHNEQIMKNRYVLSKIIDSVKFCGAFELALCGHDEPDLGNPGVFRGLIDFSSELDSALKDHLHSFPGLKGTSKDIQNELLDCMLTVCQEHIKQEIRKARYVSIIADETTDVSTVAQLAVVFRYTLTDGSPVERFWNFIEPSGHDAEKIATSIIAALDEVLDGDAFKLICQSYDGASVMSGCQGGVRAIVQSRFANAHFIHSYAHELDLVLSKACNQNTQARVFFSNVSAICNFFSNAPSRVAMLEEIVKRRVANSLGKRWNFANRSEGVGLIHEHVEDLKVCMRKIECEANQETTINQAGDIYNRLSNPGFLFWLKVFAKLMPHVYNLFNQLQKKDSDVITVLQNFKTAVNKEREGMHEAATESSNPEEDENMENGRKRPREAENSESIAAAREICDVISTQMHDRFSFTGHRAVASLLDSTKFSKYHNKFPEKALQTVISSYVGFFEPKRLHTELQVIYSRIEFRNLKGAVCLLKFFIENEISEAFSETCKLLNMLATLPVATREAEQKFETLKRVKTFLRSTVSESRLNALAMLSMEKGMVGRMEQFNEEVIDLFADRRDRRADFHLKKTYH